jgi:hypothetical protein
LVVTWLHDVKRKMLGWSKLANDDLLLDKFVDDVDDTDDG